MFVTLAPKYVQGLLSLLPTTSMGDLTERTILQQENGSSNVIGAVTVGLGDHQWDKAAYSKQAMVLWSCSPRTSFWSHRSQAFRTSAKHFLLFWRVSLGDEYTCDLVTDSLSHHCQYTLPQWISKKPGESTHFLVCKLISRHKVSMNKEITVVSQSQAPGPNQFTWSLVCFHCMIRYREQTAAHFPGMKCGQHLACRGDQSVWQFDSLECLN